MSDSLSNRAHAPQNAPSVDRIVRVVLTGAESTGKTTLARALATHYQTVWAPEYLRQFVEEKGSLPVASDALKIARGHLEQEQRYMIKANRILFLDTDLVSTCQYNQYIFGSVPEWIKTKAVERHADFYLLMDTDIPWVADPGQRDGPEVREATQKLFQAAMRSLPHAIISGSPAQRLKTATAYIDGLLAAYGGPSCSESLPDTMMLRR